MADDASYLKHILDAAEGIESDVHGLDAASFAGDRPKRNSVLHELMVFGEGIKPPFGRVSEAVAGRAVAGHYWSSQQDRS